MALEPSPVVAPPNSEVILRNTDSEVPFFAMPGWKNPSSYSDSDMEELMNEVKKEILENHVKGLETVYCVDIQTDALDLACSIVGRYYDDIMYKRENVQSRIPYAVALKVEVLQILQYACLELKNNFDKDAELTRLDMEGYLLFRNRVELYELKKEKCEFRFNHLLPLEKEYQVLRNSWEVVVENCKAILKWQKTPQRRVQIEKLRDHVFNILNSEINEDEIVPRLQVISTFIDQYQRSIPASIMQYRTVSPRIVAKIASLVTGVPTSWLLNRFQPPLDRLFDRLARKVVGQDHVIKSIVNVMTSPRERVPSPLASFLFLPSETLGAKDLFEYLAEELYDSKDRLIRIDVAKYMDGLSSSGVDKGKHIRQMQRICGDKKNAFRKRVLEVVKKTPFCALLFENVKDHKFITDILKDILRYGRLADAEGNVYELSNTLILMTSNIGTHIQRRCKCLEMDCRMKTAAMQVRSSMDHECDILPIYSLVLKRLKHITPLVDDVLVLHHISVNDKSVIARRRLREVIDASWEDHQLILYASEITLRILTTFRKEIRGRTSMKNWLNNTAIPGIRSKVNGLLDDNMTAIHIDVLVKSSDLSFRTLEVGSALDAFKNSLKQWKTVYQMEKRSALEFVKLGTMSSEMLSLIESRKGRDQVMMHLKDILDVLDGLLSNLVNSNNFVSEQYLVPPDMIESEVTNGLTELSDSDMMWDHGIKLSSSLEERNNHVATYIAEAIDSVRSAQEHHSCPKSFIFLGLNESSKADLVKVFSDLNKSSHESKPNPLISMEKYGECHSLMQFLDDISAVMLHGSSNELRQPNNTLSSPVILFDRVGDAHLSVFRALLSCLDRGVLENREGKVIDFRKTIVIIMTDLGHKKLLAMLARHDIGTTVFKEENADEGRERPFRFELLNRVGEILMFDPLLESKPEKFLKLYMKVGWKREPMADLLFVVGILFNNYVRFPDEMQSYQFEFAQAMVLNEIDRQTEGRACC